MVINIYFVLLFFFFFLEFKTPLEPFEWDLIREEGRTIDTVDTESMINDITEHEISP